MHINASKNYFIISLSVKLIQIKRILDFETNLNKDRVIRLGRFIGMMLLIYV